MKVSKTLQSRKPSLGQKLALGIAALVTMAAVGIASVGVVAAAPAAQPTQALCVTAKLHNDEAMKAKCDKKFHDPGDDGYGGGGNHNKDIIAQIRHEIQILLQLLAKLHF